MIYGLLGISEHDNSIIFDAAQTFAFCEAAEVEEKRPKRRWPDSADHWSEHDAKLKNEILKHAHRSLEILSAASKLIKIFKSMVLQLKTNFCFGQGYHY